MPAIGTGGVGVGTVVGTLKGRGESTVPATHADLGEGWVLVEDDKGSGEKRGRRGWSEVVAKDQAGAVVAAVVKAGGGGLHRAGGHDHRGAGLGRPVIRGIEVHGEILSGLAAQDLAREGESAEVVDVRGDPNNGQTDRRRLEAGKIRADEVVLAGKETDAAVPAGSSDGGGVSVPSPAFFGGEISGPEVDQAAESTSNGGLGGRWKLTPRGADAKDRAGAGGKEGFPADRAGHSVDGAGVKYGCHGRSAYEMVTGKSWNAAAGL